MEQLSGGGVGGIEGAEEVLSDADLQGLKSLAQLVADLTAALAATNSKLESALAEYKPDVDQLAKALAAAVSESGVSKASTEESATPIDSDREQRSEESEAPAQSSAQQRKALALKWRKFLDHLHVAGFFAAVAAAEKWTTPGDALVNLGPYGDYGDVKKAVLLWAQGHDGDWTEQIKSEWVRPLVEASCPTRERKVVNAAKRLRDLLMVSEVETCKVCPLAIDCQRAYQIAQGEGAFADVARVVLAQMTDPIMYKMSIRSTETAAALDTLLDNFLTFFDEEAKVKYLAKWVVQAPGPSTPNADTGVSHEQVDNIHEAVKAADLLRSEEDSSDDETDTSTSFQGWRVDKGLINSGHSTPPKSDALPAPRRVKDRWRNRTEEDWQRVYAERARARNISNSWDADSWYQGPEGDREEGPRSRDSSWQPSAESRQGPPPRREGAQNGVADSNREAYSRRRANSPIVGDGSADADAASPRSATRYTVQPNRDQSESSKYRPRDADAHKRESSRPGRYGEVKNINEKGADNRAAYSRRRANSSTVREGSADAGANSPRSGQRFTLQPSRGGTESSEALPRDVDADDRESSSTARYGQVKTNSVKGKYQTSSKPAKQATWDSWDFSTPDDSSEGRRSARPQPGRRQADGRRRTRSPDRDAE
eukprot:jgi/Chlat1/4973/Chrsp32S04955